MDPQTLAAYDQDAAAFAQDWLGQPSPVDLQEIVERFFVRGGNSADIGCGCGREVAWLHANGFSAVGFDASEALPLSLLAGDRRIQRLTDTGEPAQAMCNTVGTLAYELTVASASDYRWYSRTHVSGGNLALADGSVQKARTLDLPNYLRHTEDAGGNNHIQKP